MKYKALFKRGPLDSPVMLTWLSALGVIGLIITTHRAAAEYTREVIEAEDAEYPLDIKDKLSIGAKHYIQPAIVATTTLTCIFGNHYVNETRYGALAAAYSIVSTTLSKYDRSVLNVLGKRKREAIRSEMETDNLKNTEPPKDLILSPGDVLCFDSLSARYFSSSVTKIERAVNEFNQKLIGGLFLSLNDFYDILDLPNIGIGDKIGWMSDHGLLECIFHAKIRGSDSQPCIVVDYQTLPAPYNY